MKTKVLLFINALFILFFTSCSNADRTAEQIENENYSLLLAEAKPYISSGMQELINKLDTATTPPSFEEVIPFIERLLSKDSLISTSKTVTRTNVDGTTVTDGYSKITTLFNRKAVSISNSSSSLRESLGYSFKLEPSSSTEIVYLTCKAVCNYVYFSEVVAFSAAYAEGDFMGINPEAFDTNITDNSILEQGYFSEEKVAGRLYYLTTYIFEAYVSSTADIIKQILPSNGVFYTDMEMYGNRFQWRYYAL